MKTDKLIGILLILGAVGVFIPYTILTFTFNYPDVLRLESGQILTQFHQGGKPLIFTWLSFALLGLPLLVAYTLIGQKLDKTISFVRWATNFGIISGVVQIIGLLRWVFVVPVLATGFADASDPSTKNAIAITFQAIHQFAGVLLGEHLGQLFTIFWTVLIAAALLKVRIIPKWLAWWGYIASFIYFLAQAELLATVMPGFPTIAVAGLLGSSLWLVWLILVGIKFLKVNTEINTTKL